LVIPVFTSPWGWVENILINVLNIETKLGNIEDNDVKSAVTPGELNGEKEDVRGYGLKVVGLYPPNKLALEFVFELEEVELEAKLLRIDDKSGEELISP
jgi:hypothetical protein